ncbi:MAG: winged helix-turn-helix transcriptional regulator [candidate division NC10 bacterium]|nr:winged helix-turn-helix transcriptional regulator [candidate division NC10 bacterium]
MLRRLFSSQTRVDLLVLLLGRPEERFYVRELARQLKRDISGIKRELDNLEKAGILQSVKAGNLRYYSASPRSPVYSELKAIVDKTRAVPGTVGAALRRVKGIVVAFLYGAKADALATDAGALDLIVVGSPEMPALNQAVADLEQRLGREINLLAFDRAEFVRRREEGDPFLTEVLQGDRVVVAGSDEAL